MNFSLSNEHKFIKLQSPVNIRINKQTETQNSSFFEHDLHTQSTSFFTLFCKLCFYQKIGFKTGYNPEKKWISINTVVR